MELDILAEDVSNQVQCDLKTAGGLRMRHLIGKAKLAGQVFLCFATYKPVRIGSPSGWWNARHVQDGTLTNFAKRRKNNRLIGQIGHQAEPNQVGLKPWRQKSTAQLPSPLSAHSALSQES
ncbi:hypothetical protein GWK36_09835 [Caldichromatium japonicum]|uniref:Uncharacterized protein n=1 Tax=Caldichromatium japonicum TaxID=2699430 RepID=A0A6G7VED2_9GAMM|nr:hypothetical protein GWK36_09835 [Caldichromatium japonicum]